MHVTQVLHHWLAPLLSCIHAKRLESLLDAVAACIAGLGLSLTTVGRRLSGTTSLKHKIKRADRLLGNRRLYAERSSVYKALCRLTLLRLSEPLVLVDWTDLKKDQSLQLLRASVPVGGHSLTLYEEVHPKKRYGNRDIQTGFLRKLAELLPPGVTPTIVADAGFHVPFFRAVEHLGWRWVGRLRGTDYVQLDCQWQSGKSLFSGATSTPRRLGVGQWVKSNPLDAVMVLVRFPRKGRSAKTAAGKRARSRKSLKAARSWREPWFLVACVRFADAPAKTIVRTYRQRMQIEQSFRHFKSLYFGEGYECHRSRTSQRIAILVLVASLVIFVEWAIGVVAQRAGLERGKHASSSKRRVYSAPFLARLILQLTPSEFDLLTIPPPDQLVSECHDAIMNE
jgi:hypothetical protein